LVTTVTKLLAATDTPIDADYTTLVAALTAVPADLVAADQAWILEVDTQGGALPLGQTSKFSKTFTTDATRTLTIRAATGKSIFDSTDNPMDYDASLGAAIESSVTWSVAVELNIRYLTIEGLQFKNTTGGGGGDAGCLKVGQADGSGEPGQIILDSNIFYSPDVAWNLVHVYTSTGSKAATVQNNLFVTGAAGSVSYYAYAYNHTLQNNTFICTGTSGTRTGARLFFPVNDVLQNNIFAGFTAEIDNETDTTITSDHNATTNANWSGSRSPGANPGLSGIAFSTDTFVSLTAGSEDYNLAAASDLIDAGTSDGTPTTDAYGRDRSTNDIGASEYVAASSTDALTATDLTAAAPVLDAATLSQVHALTAADTTAAAAVLGAASLGQVHALTAADTTATAAEIGQATLSQAHVLAAADALAAAPELQAAALTQVHALIAEDLILPAMALDGAALGQVHTLVAGDTLAAAADLPAATLAQASALTAADTVAAASELEAAAIGQVHALTVGDVIAGAPELLPADLAQVHALLAADLTAAAPDLAAATLNLVETVALIAADLILAAFVLDAATLTVQDGRLARPRTPSLPAIARAAGTAAAARPAHTAASPR
jgi:hypothetical protein